MKKRNITVNTCRNLIEVKHEQDLAVFETVGKPGEMFEEKVKSFLTKLCKFVIN